MKIEWIGPTRLVPRLGILEKGAVRVVDDEIGKSLVKQKLAKNLNIKRKKKSKSKE